MACPGLLLPTRSAAPVGFPARRGALPGGALPLRLSSPPVLRRAGRIPRTVVSADANAGQESKAEQKAASPEGPAPGAGGGTAEPTLPPRATSSSKRTAESTDWIASAVTRRFGIGAGLAWVGFLAFGVISEQLKTRNEVYLEQTLTRDVEDAEEVVLSNGLIYRDLRVGGGATPQPGDLVVLSLVGRVQGSVEPFVDTTKAGSRDAVFTFGSKLYRGGVCEGLVYALASMKAGGKRVAKVPSKLGFGDQGAVIRASGSAEDVEIPGGSDLEYIVELKKVSISPA